jgi:hypothetical protein
MPRKDPTFEEKRLAGEPAPTLATSATHGVHAVRADRRRCPARLERTEPAIGFAFARTRRYAHPRRLSMVRL